MPDHQPLTPAVTGPDHTPVLFAQVTVTATKKSDLGQSVHATAEGFTTDGKPTGLTLTYWTHPEEHNVPRVGDKYTLQLTPIDH